MSPTSGSSVSLSCADCTYWHEGLGGGFWCDKKRVDRYWAPWGREICDHFQMDHEAVNE